MEHVTFGPPGVYSSCPPGLFGLHRRRDFKTIAIRDNVIECKGQARPLFRNSQSYSAAVENNRLVNVSDAGKLANRKTGRPSGLAKPLRFAYGVHGAFTVDGWNAGPTVRGSSGVGKGERAARCDLPAAGRRLRSPARSSQGLGLEVLS